MKKEKDDTPNQVNPLIFDRNNFPSLIIFLAGSLCSLIGAIVLVGWYTNTPMLFQILPGLNPMYYNTALSFVILGMGLIALYFRYNNLAILFGVSLLLIGGITSVEYYSIIDLGIDRFFFDILTFHSENICRCLCPESTLQVFPA